MLKITDHVLQSDFWKQVRNEYGNKTVDFEGGWFQINTVPYSKWKIGYAPRISAAKTNLESLADVARREGVIFVKVDPAEIKSQVPNPKSQTNNSKLKTQNSKPRHLSKTILINLSIPEEERLQQLDKKIRYTIKQSLKESFEFKEDDSPEQFLKLNAQTIERQNYGGRPASYLQRVWNIGQKFNSVKVFTTYLNSEPQVSSMIFLYKDVLYYTYAGSSESSRNNNAAYFHVWSLLEWGRKNGYIIFDFWGLEENTKDGFSLFKKKFGGEVVEYAETVDVVIKPLKYRILRLLEIVRSLKS